MIHCNYLYAGKNCIFSCLSFQGAIVAIKRINRSSININKPLLMAIKRVRRRTDMIMHDVYTRR